MTRVSLLCGQVCTERMTRGTRSRAVACESVSLPRIAYFLANSSLDQAAQAAQSRVALPVISSGRSSSQ